MRYAESFSFPYRDQIRSYLPSPTLNIAAESIHQHIEDDVGSDGTVLIVGCGEGGEGLSGFSEGFLENNVIGIDIRETSFTELLGDIHQLPIRDESIDAIVCQAVLEHIEGADIAVDEFTRVLKLSGLLYIDVPFLQGYHALPTDYRRFTSVGLEKAVTKGRSLQTIDSGASKGPTSVLIWITCEYLAYLLSFGNYTLRKTLSVGFRILTSWMKYFDRVLLKTHGFDVGSMTIPSAVYWYGRKIDTQSVSSK
ncbi:class I SAM-dependent methyltransferase [Halorubrum ezzemoulense]|uniref:class I SAM-dependent methyltransferase n=1 Tax=Halorubrum ezzemoulense TaxID=337243 RepID=UPI00232EE0A5|nr:class I SAM-dependent methyltransferase [Halorubrum ezzemoulense]MDB2286704.1 class I SAM-dependent methyltransferase [Halorubrum ezzemoulense]